MGTGTLALAFACQQGGLILYCVGMMGIAAWNVLAVDRLLSCLKYIIIPEEEEQQQHHHHVLDASRGREHATAWELQHDSDNDDDDYDYEVIRSRMMQVPQQQHGPSARDFYIGTSCVVCVWRCRSTSARCHVCLAALGYNCGLHCGCH